jgi:transcriptional regulator with XRE-family HTH domain
MLDNTLSISIPMAAKEKTFYAQLGRRIAERRKAQDITQVELAKLLGIAQQTMAHYEGGVSRVAVAHLPTLARALDMSIEELVGSENRKAAGKRGPAPKIQQQLERIHALPKPQQRALMQVIDSVLQQHGASR